ncbi:MAG: hypothetical protein M9894_10645 [Planctomycetes bacterium]|nr:hypothetical protein [Planctomycetota bacterium]
MELERGERLVEGRQLLTPLAGLSLLAAFLIVAEWGLGWVTALLALAVVVAAWSAALWNARHLAITDRRIIEYRVFLARLARRFPRFAPLEAHRRRVFPLQDLASVRRSGAALILRLRTGATHTVPCHTEDEAARLLAVVDDFLRRAPWLRPARRTIEPTLSVSVSASADAEPGRCPYCHDAVPPEEAAPCDRCGAVHHEECLGIHGGCAAFSCLGERRARVRG